MILEPWETLTVSGSIDSNLVEFTARDGDRQFSAKISIPRSLDRDSIDPEIRNLIERVRGVRQRVLDLESEIRSEFESLRRIK